ncbi:hypothetical protein [uncultured Methanobrevibacter sp.]|nr:hypothetical protein [uncultured Methanobrevibacter sp.]
MFHKSNNRVNLDEFPLIFEYLMDFDLIPIQSKHPKQKSNPIVIS